ncbi:LPS-assembly protein LptD [Sulfurimonas sp. SAG-AH-194-C20]|nr:LPS assembly protein LptD [Sulfurimonas sp. SAG-AH-194-C20]MDF1878753.1 LPS-assembly protein LptD [Sulfurimonas sp. SAG-AH-194-C20]
MLKILLFLLPLLVTLHASQKVEIFASEMNSEGDVVKANGGVTVVYKKYFITADRAVYDRNSSVLELFDNIRVNKDKSYKVLGNYAKLNLAKKEKFFKPFYISDKESRVWISANNGNAQDTLIDIGEGILSGCNPIDPIWKIEFSSSSYNSDSKWINLYNARLYIDDIPIFYIPYFGFSLDTQRKSGLLMPSIGYSANEGTFYEQPIYIAVDNWWDLELKPQIRTQRGQGIYQKFRFVDSATSRGEFTTGYFKESGKYYKDNNLQNNSHYGFSFKYDNNDFLNQWLGVNLEGQSGIYADISRMNDVDYINLSSNDVRNNSTATQVLSRINLFYNTDTQYVGTYFKYYQDLTLVSNDNTLQKLPTLQYHYYLDTFLQNHLLYNLDVQSNNLTRVINKTAIQTDINLPVTLQTSLFDEYINISYKANLYMQYSNFGASEQDTTLNNEFNDGYILRNFHTIGVSSQLTRGYEDFSHVISFGVSYNKAGTQSSNGYYSDYESICSNSQNQNDPRCEFYSISDIQEEAQVDFIEYLYDDKAKEILYHRLAQKISYANPLNRYGELENELNYKVTDYLSFYNNMFYNYEEASFSKVFNQVSLKKFGINLSLSHLYKDTYILTTSETPEFTSYLTSTLGYTYNNHYSFSALYNYDAIDKIAKTQEIGFMYKKRCWDFGIRYSENRRPILSNDITSFVNERYIYFTILLKPLMKANGSSNITMQLPNAN